MTNRYYIGLATSNHDPAIAIIDGDGNVLFAEAAERRYQVKRAAGCAPVDITWAEELIREYCPPPADYTIAKSWSSRRSRITSLLFLTGLDFDLNERSKAALIRVRKLLPGEFNKGVLFFKNSFAMKINASTSIEKVIRFQEQPGTIRTECFDHHLSHAGLACYGSPFNEAVCLVVDGEGERGAFSIYRYGQAKISLLEGQNRGASLGSFYARLTSFCGFDAIKGEEWKVMGLAAYGSFDERLYRLFRSLYSVRGSQLVKTKISIQAVAKTIESLTSADPTNFSLKADIAYNGQRAYCDWMNELIINIHKKYPSDNLILTGGCALNSSHNGEILDKTPFKSLYIPPAPADDGCALGGALLAYYKDNPCTESTHKNISPYLGSEISNAQLEHFLKFSGQSVRKLSRDKYEVVARLLDDGKVIGWIQGNAEFGPRSLGNRSILADPRKKEMKDILNERVKFREEFRPFAPSILHEYGNEYFENYQESQYMERTLTFKKEAINKVPGVVHINNTGRLQTVKEEWNAEFHYLISAFYEITGVPLLLNTSFNVMGKPIIHTIEDALSTYFTTGIDALIINDYLIQK